jgi:hypothetical protein
MSIDFVRIIEYCFKIDFVGDNVDCFKIDWGLTAGDTKYDLSYFETLLFLAMSIGTIFINTFDPFLLISFIGLLDFPQLMSLEHLII